MHRKVRVLFFCVSYFFSILFDNSIIKEGEKKRNSEKMEAEENIGKRKEEYPKFRKKMKNFSNALQAVENIFRVWYNRKRGNDYEIANRRTYTFGFFF